MTKLAIFDVDWTIIKPKNGRPFPKDKYDWMWLRESVPEILLHYYINDYQLVFLTDQSKDWKVDMIEGIIDLLNLNIILIVSRNKSTNKPNPQLFNQMITFPYRKRSSIMVGDAAGRTGDWADVDKEFSILLCLFHFLDRALSGLPNPGNDRNAPPRGRLARNPAETAVNSYPSVCSCSSV